MPLSYDWTALNAKIDAMTPTGNTNVTIGLAWGFQTYSPVAPFNAAAGVRPRQGHHPADRRREHAELNSKVLKLVIAPVYPNGCSNPDRGRNDRAARKAVGERARSAIGDIGAAPRGFQFVNTIIGYSSIR